MLNIHLTGVVITRAGIFLGPLEIVTEENRHHFNTEMVERFATGSPAFLEVENRYADPTVPSGINRKTVEKFFNDLVDEHYRLPGNIEEFIDELVAGKMGYAKLRRGDHLRAFSFMPLEISKFIPNED